MSPLDPAEAVARAARGGIHSLAIPTPFLVGRVNLLLIEDDPLTLVDVGPNSGTSLDALERALAEHGRRIEDLELLLITHQHVDHSGLLQIVARRSGAEVAAFAPLVPWLADYRGSAASDDAYAQGIMRRYGVPEDVLIALGAVAAAFRAYGSSGRVTRPLRDGDTLALRDRTFTVHHRPGHSPSDLIFFDEERSLLIGGDHLLGHISSNPIISRPLQGGTPAGSPQLPPPGRELAVNPTPADCTSAMPRTRPLLDYIASMRATAEMPIEIVLPGHGDAVTDPAGLVAERLRLHERRARKILRMLADTPLTPHEIAIRMWGNVAVTQAFLTLSEVLGHLDLLEAEGRVVEDDDGAGPVRFRTTDA